MMFQNKEDIPHAVWGNPNPNKPNWVAQPLRRLDVVVRGRAAVGRVLDPPGRELGHDHPRDQPQHLLGRRQQQQSVRHAVPPRRLGDLGHDGPRVLQRPRRPAQPLAGAGAVRGVDGRRAHAALARSAWASCPTRRCCGSTATGSRSPASRWRTWSRARSTPSRSRRASAPASRSSWTARRRSTRSRRVTSTPTRRATAAGRAGLWTNYSLETVQRVGYGSFEPDNGVLIAKNKAWAAGAIARHRGLAVRLQLLHLGRGRAPGGHQPVDYYKPDGTPIMRTVADYRQLNDALFHAGTNSGSSAEYVDAANNLHFYVIDKYTDARGILHYTWASRTRPAPARRRAASRWPTVGRRRAQLVHVQAHQHGRGRADRSRPAPAGRAARRWTTTSTGSRPRPRARAGRRSCATRWRRRSSATASTCRSTSRTPRRAEPGNTVTLTATSVVGPVQDGHRDLRADARPAATSAARCRRRCRSRSALRPRSARSSRAWTRSTSRPRRPRSPRPPATRR